MSVKLLPKEIRSKIRSGVNINTLVDCVEALVQNAIDAHASCVAVRIDLPFYKIQVVDNGHGINKQDFQLIGERGLNHFRYATSKCHHLSDVGNPMYYGFRGEALASLRDISEEMTVVSRAEHEDMTRSKSFRGSVSRIDVSALRRPSRGTTVTIFGFLYNLPVRQAALIGPMELERVRRSLESFAIINPSVSFSLRDDSNESWCFQVPKTDSVSTTFAHIFGSCWATALKPVSRTASPFHLDGYLSLRGHRNKNLQFLFLHRQRILGHRLELIINQIHASISGFNASPRRNSDAVDRHPVFVLKIECTAEFYDIGFHPSKTVVEFQKFDILVELVKSMVSTFFEKSVASSGETSELQPQEDPAVINAQNYKNSLHSLAAKRAHKLATMPDPTTETVSEGFKTPKNICGPFVLPKTKHRPLMSVAEIFQPFDSDDSTCPIQLSPEQDHRKKVIDERTQDFTAHAEAPLQATSKDVTRTPKNVHDTSVIRPKITLKPSNSSAEHSDTSYVRQAPSEAFTGDSPCPIHLSPALDHKRKSLVNFIDVKERQERICRAITELKRFSHKNRQPETGQMTPDGDFDGHFRKDAPSTHSNPARKRVAITPDVSIAQNRSRVPRSVHFPAKKRAFPSTEGLQQSESGYFPNSLLRDMPRHLPADVKIPQIDTILSSECISTQSFMVSPASTFQTLDQLSLKSQDDTATHQPLVSLSMDYPAECEEIQKSLPSSLEKTQADVPHSASRITPAHTSENKPHLESIIMETNPLSMDLENSTGQIVSRWFHDIDPLSKRNIYVNTETGHSYFGQSPPSDSPSLTTTLITGHPLPLDTSVSDHRLATGALPFRPWCQHTEDPEAIHSSEETTRSNVKQMLKTWENPVFKCDPMSNPALFNGKFGGTSSEFVAGLQPYTLDKDIFDDIRVIAQVDQKFIICSCRRSMHFGSANEKEVTSSRHLLVAFDQHAVHERIRLEKLIRDAENEDCSDRLKTSPLDPPVTVHLASSIARICLSHQQELMTKGIEISSCLDTDEEQTPVCISVIPKCLVDVGKGHDPELIENLLCELVETLEETGTFGVELSKTIVDLLKSQACHGAIKFGDALSIVDCQNLMKMLGECKSPFFCAHGRPSVVPLFDYNCLRNVDTDQIVKPKLWKLTRR